MPARRTRGAPKRARDDVYDDFAADLSGKCPIRAPFERRRSGFAFWERR